MLDYCWLTDEFAILETISPKPFVLATRSEVQQFESQLTEYVNTRTNFALPYISLLDAFDAVISRSDSEKVFTALLDIVINLNLVWCDQIASARAWGELVDNGKINTPLLEDTVSFFSRMDIHRFSTAYIFRCRALWDKIMGFFILYFDPARYEDFAKAKSKRRTFKKIAAAGSNIPSEYLTQLDSLINDFDDRFRSPEAHGTGSIRKWSLSHQAGINNPHVSLGSSWNQIAPMLIVIGLIFTPSKTSELIKI